MKNIAIFIVLISSSGELLPSTWHTVFAHGIVDGPTQIHRFEDAIGTTTKSALSFPDAKPATGFGFNYGISKITYLLGKHVNRNRMYMAQGNDIKAMNHFIEQTALQESSNKNFILYGCSRGAATVINYMAKHNPENVQALVLDACPASMHEAIQPTLIKFGINPSRAHAIFSTLFPKYPKRNPINPFNSIKDIKNKNLPILLIHSADDSVVPYEHSLMLYREFIDQGFTNVHILTIASGRHSYLLQNKQVKPQYLQAVHSFYKKYNMPYHEALAKIDISSLAIKKDIVSKKILAYQNFILQKATT